MTKNEIRLVEIAVVLTSTATGMISGWWGFVVFFALGAVTLCFDALTRAVREKHE